MSKRPASTTISCPGCTTKFDSQIHVPLIGSCGHSICSVCTNEKKITACPVCHNPAGFLWKQKNELATELLTMMAEKKAKRPRLEPAEESKKTIPAILDQANFDVMLKIVNQLKPHDFLKLAQTCKTMYNFCFKTKEIKIFHNILGVKVANSPRSTVFAMGYQTDDLPFYEDKYWPLSYNGNDEGFLNTRSKRKKLRKYPFIFNMYQILLFAPATTKALATLRSFLSEFPVKEIYEIWAWEIVDWNGFIQFVKDFHPCEVDIYGPEAGGIMPRDAATYFLQNKEIKFTSYLRVADDLILGSSLRSLDLSSSPISISKETFEALVVKFAHSTEPVDWFLGCQDFDFNPSILFKKVLPFDHVGRVSKKRPLLFVMKETYKIFYILRKDGKLIYCSCLNFAKFCIINFPPSLPPCLHPTPEKLKLVASKKPKLEAAEKSENPFAALFDPENKKLLTRVVNKFEPNDFVNLAMTCSKMKNFCLDNEEIQIIYDDLYVNVDLSNGVPLFGVAKASDHLDNAVDDDGLYPQNYRGTSGGFFSTPKNRKKLRKAPFVFKVDTLNIDGTLTSSALLAIRSFLSEFPVKSIDKVNANGITDWNGFTKLLMDFKPRILEIYSLDEGDTSIPDATINYILQNTVKITCDLPISDRIILESPSNVTLELRSSISKETFEDLVVKCTRSKEDIDWNLGCRQFQFDVYSIFKKVLDFNHEGRVSKKRPLAFVKENEPYHFYILRKDGKVAHCIKMVDGPAQFVMLAPKDYPPCLQNA